MSNTVLITGANRGIGLALSKRFKQNGDRVIAVCRRTSQALRDIADQVIGNVDVTSKSDLATLTKKLGNEPIDILINNAGILSSESINMNGATGLDFEAIEEQFKVNALGPLMVTQTLMPNLTSGSKIALITSRMGSMEDNESGGYYGYRASKSALNAFGKSLANDLKSQNIPVALLHPGFVQTEMVGGAGDISADTAAERLFDRIQELNLENTGSFWHSNGELLPW